MATVKYLEVTEQSFESFMKSMTPAKLENHKKLISSPHVKGGAHFFNKMKTGLA